jgi:YidC/Oxa1 family membrane protein insertase
MEKRVILTFILCFLVLVVWSHLFAPKTKPPLKEEERPKEQERQLQSSPHNAQLIKPSPLPEREISKADTEIPSIKITDTIVETPLYRVVFTNEGPAITSFKLMKYHETVDPDSPPVEFVNSKELSDDFIIFNLNNQKAPENRKFIYDVDENFIRLTPGSYYRDLTFSCPDANGMSVKQTFRFYPDKYDIDLIITAMNKSDYPITRNIEAKIHGMPPMKKKSYYSFVGMALLLDNELEEIKPKKMEEEKTLSGKIDWVAYENDYFISAVVPENLETGYFRGRLLPTGIIKGAYITPEINLNPLEQISIDFTLFVGPKDIDILSRSGKKLDEAIDFGFFDIIAKPLHFILRFFNRYVHNYGISIIILTIIIKILFWPLTQKSHKSMKEMRKIQPLMTKIREKYKDNREQMNKEMMALYRTYKVNPMGGCLPMLIQLPVLYAMFRILGKSIELRHAPFILWINDLSAPDRLFNFSFSIPFMSPPYGIPVLTLLMGASMFIQQKMQPMAGDPAQAKVMMFLPIIFTIMFINFPSGLVLYWLIQNILTIGQQYLIQKKPD